jgi:hypothetical protein
MVVKNRSNIRASRTISLVQYCFVQTYLLIQSGTVDIPEQYRSLEKYCARDTVYYFCTNLFTKTERDGGYSGAIPEPGEVLRQRL